MILNHRIKTHAIKILIFIRPAPIMHIPLHRCLNKIIDLESDLKLINYIVKGKKGSLAPMQLLPPLFMHEICNGHKSRASYTHEAESILRDGQPINWQEQN